MLATSSTFNGTIMKFLFLFPLNLFAFTLNTSNAVSFDTDIVKIRVSDTDCTNISLTADELESIRERQSINTGQEYQQPA